MKYHFKGLSGTDDDGLCVMHVIKDPQFISFDQMLKIMKILEEEE